MECELVGRRASSRWRCWSPGWERNRGRRFRRSAGSSSRTFPRVVKLADNVYGYEEIRQPGFTTVSLIVVGGDGVLLADGQGSPAATQTLLDHIARLTPKPLKWYVVGSDHGDHTAGNSVLPQDLTYIVHPTSRAQMERDAASAMGANLKAAAEALTKGQPAPTPRPPVIVPPAAMTGDRQVIDVGGFEVQVLFLGRAHTGGDLHVLLPKQRILFMSEALPEPRVPGDAFGLSHRVGGDHRQGAGACRSIASCPGTASSRSRRRRARSWSRSSRRCGR